MQDENIIKIANKTYDLRKYTEDEKFRLRQLKLQEEHRGHETMHVEMFFIAIISLILSQILLMVWRNKHFKSYQFATLLGLIFVPLILGIYTVSLRFLSVYTVFFIITGYMSYIATRKPIKTTTPRRVYGWFLLVHNVTYTVGVAGYMLLFVLLLSGANDFLSALALYMLFYGIYFGVVSRDFAEVCSDKMASKIGYYAADGMTMRSLDPTKCSICTNPLIDPSSSTGDETETLFKLNCSHSFHEQCIRGWCIVGKKDICPYCKEKVDLKTTFTNPWQKPHILYGSYLDWIRYLVAWQPIVLFFITYLNKFLGLK